MAKKIWDKRYDGTSESYSLSKEYCSDWFASVFMHEGKWTFRFGRRGTHESYSSSKKFLTPESAKTSALKYLSQKTFLKR